MSAAQAIFSRAGAVVAVAVLTLGVLPFRTFEVGNNPSFMPSYLAILLAANLFTACFLYQQFSVSGRFRLLAVAGAYLYSAFCVVGQALTFPGVMSANGPLASSPSNSPWLWTLWHAGFAALIAAGLLIEKQVNRRSFSRRSMVRGSVGFISTLALGMFTLVVGAPDALPTVIQGNDYGSLLATAGPWVIGLNVLGVAVTYWKTRSDHNVERWVLLTMTMSLAEVLLVLLAGERYTLGWYTSRGVAVLASGVFLMALATEVAELYRKAESAKRILEDEALDLLRQKRGAQYREDRIRRILENAADGYIEMSRSGAIQGWNGKSSEMFGWSAEEAMDQAAVALLVSDESNGAASEGINQLWGYAGRFEGVRSEFMVKHRAGHTFPVEMTLWVDESGMDPRMCAFIRDITARRAAEAKMQLALEEERKAVLRLQELDKAKSDFVSSISHELRSPLTSTLGYLEILGDGGAGDLNEEQAHMIEIADRNAKRLKALIEDLLTLSRIESGQFGVKFRPVNISKVIENAIAANSAFASDRGVRVTVDVAESLGVCPGDDIQITRALGNVINNAVKFTPPTGKISISAKADGDHVIVRVADHGIGIPLQEQPKLFQRFFRTSLSVEQQHQGAGLGLTITKAIVDHHGGTIDFQSTEGEGTEMRVRLPMMPIAV